LNTIVPFSKIMKLIYKFLFSLLLLCSGVFAFSIDKVPKPSGPVADYAGIIETADKQQIFLIAERLWEKAKIGIVVVTLPEIGDETIEEVANRLYEKWGIGSAKTDEGILLLVSMNPRKIRIETGYGSESYLNDAKVGRILDTYAMPYLSSGRYSEGIRSTIMAVAASVGNASGNDNELQDAESTGSVPRMPSIFKLIVFIIVAMFLLGTRPGRMILFAMILSGGRGGYRGGGGFGGGFGGGGFGGGFGGGRSGGGGASRSF
jgi:uncharacterized protein